MTDHPGYQTHPNGAPARANNREDTYDVIVVGAGHNGLTTAAYLARARLDVLVLEAAPTVGGMSSTSAPIPDAPEHHINPCAVDMILLQASPVAHDLDLARHGFATEEVDPPFVGLGPEGASLAIHRDPARTADEIRRFSRADAESYLDLMRLFDAALDVGLPVLTSHPTRPDPATIGRVVAALGRRASTLARLAPLLRHSAADVLRERFTHPMVQSPMAVLCGLGPLAQAGSAWYLSVYALVHRLGVHRVVGGTQRLPDALQASFEEAGGTVRTSASVDEILLRAGRVHGVRLVSGEAITAPVVVAACDPHTALTRLLPDDALTQRTAARAERIPTDNGNMASLKVDMAFSGRLELRRHQMQRNDGLDLRRPTALIGSIDDVLDSHERAARGEMPTRQALYGVIPTGADPTQAPEGQDTLYLWQGWVPERPEQRWDDKDAVRDAGDALVAAASLYYDGIDDVEIGRDVETWPALRARTGAADGALFHVDMRPSRLGPLRPAAGFAGYSTPVDGMFLTGNGTHPGGGVSGLAGKQAAATVLRTIPRRRSRV